MATKTVRVVLDVVVDSDDHNDPQPTAAEVREHVLQEINGAKGQYAHEDWRHAVKATLGK